MIDYSDATVTILYVVQDSSREIAQGRGVSFVNCLYLISLIDGQSLLLQNQTGTHTAVTQ